MAVGTKIGDLFFDVSADTAKAVAGIPKAGASLGASLTKSIGRGIGGAVSAMTQPLIAGLESAAAVGAAAFGAVLTTGFSRLRAIDDAQGKLTALGHTTEETALIMDNALKAVLGTQYNLGEAATVAASAVAAGIKPGEELTRYLGLIADTATVAGISMADAGAIINKTTAFQRVYLREINQLAQRGIPIFSWLQEEYGVTGERLREMVSAGEVDAATFQRVIQEHIGGAAVEFGMATFSGGLKNTFAAMGRLGEQLLGPFFFALRDFGFPAMIEFFDELTAAVTPIMQNLADSEGFRSLTSFLERLPSFAKPAVDALSGIGPALGPIIGILGAGGLGSVSKLLGPLGVFIPKIGLLSGAFLGLVATSPELRSALGELFGSLMEVLGALATEIMPLINQLLPLIGEGLAVVVEFLARQIEKLVPVIEAAGDFIRYFIDAFNGVDTIQHFSDQGGMVADVARRMGDALREFVDWFIAAWPTILDVGERVIEKLIDVALWLVDTFIAAWPTIKDIVQTTVSTIGDTISWLVDAFVDAWPTIQDVVKTAIGAIVDAGAWLVDWFVANWPTIKDVVRTVIDAVITSIEWVVDNVVPALVSAFKSVVAWVKANWPGIRDTVVEIVAAIQTAIMWFIDNVLPDLIDGFRAVWDFIKQVWPDIQQIVMSALQAIGVIIGVAVVAIMLVWDNFGRNIVDRVTTVWGLISGLIQAALDIIKGILDIFVGIFTGDWQRVWDGVKSIVDGVWQAIITIIDYGINTAKDIIALAMAVLSLAWEQTWGNIKLFLTTIWDAMVLAVTEYIEAVKLVIQTVTDAIRAVWEMAWSAMSTFLSVTWDIIKAAVSTAIGIVETAISGLWGWFQTLWDRGKEVADFFATPFSWAFAIAEGALIKLKNALLGVWEWFKSLWDRGVEVGAWIAEKFQPVIDSIKDAFNFWKGAAEGVVDAIQWVIDKANAAMGPLRTLIDLINKIPIIGGDGGGSGGVPSPGDPFGRGTGARALGGPVVANNPYFVGERGMELFVPNRSGTIIPNNVLERAMSSGSGVSFSVQVTVEGGNGYVDVGAIQRGVEQGALAALAQYTRARG